MTVVAQRRRDCETRWNDVGPKSVSAKTLSSYQGALMGLELKYAVQVGEAKGGIALGGKKLDLQELTRVTHRPPMIGMR